MIIDQNTIRHDLDLFLHRSQLQHQQGMVMMLMLNVLSLLLVYNYLGGHVVKIHLLIA